MSASQSPQALFQKALQDFKDEAGLTTDEEAQFKLTTLEELQKTVQATQLKQESSRRLRYMRRLQIFVDTMDQYGKVIEVFVNAADMVAFIWGPMKLLLQIASNFSEGFNALLEAYQEIGENMPQVIQYKELFHENTNMQKVLAMIYADLLEFHREALRCFKGRMWKQLFTATWRGFASKVKLMTEDMRRHTHLLESQAGIVEFEELLRLRAQSKAQFEEMREREQLRRRTFVIKWLSAAPSQVIQEKGVEARSLCSGSGRWLLSDNRFVNWFHSKFCRTPLLWLSSIPGAGKTVLASLIVEEAQKLPDTTVAFFYCRYQDAERNSFLALARGILSQLLSQNDGEDLLLYLYEKATGSGEAALASAKLAKEILETTLGKCTKTYIVIDGLDECNREERKEVSHFFRRTVEVLPKSEPDRIRCLFISQDDGAARKDFKSLAKIEVAEKDNKPDIKEFVEAWQQKIKDKFDLDLTKYNLAEIVVSGSKGMFLFAKLVTEHLYEQPTLKHLERELQPDVFPKGIGDAYKRILNRIGENTSEAKFESAMMVLGWIVCAKRPLKWREIQGAVSIDWEAKTVDYKGKLNDDPKDLCASLVERRSDDSMELVHTTAKKYLISEQHIRPLEVEYELALRGLRYLSFSPLTLPFVDDEELESDVEEAILDGYYAFLDYAVVFWVAHFEESIPTYEDKDRRDSINEDLEEFLTAHWSSSKVKLPVPFKVKAKLERFKSQELYERLTQAFVFSRKQKGHFGKAPSDEDSLDLHRVVSRVRTILEGLGSSTRQAAHEARLTEFHGPHWFKCPRMNCLFFEKGYKARADREEHIARHERAFLCSFEGCHHADMGFATSKELDRHLSAVHNLDITEDLEFPETPKPQKKQQGHIPCPECGEMFTRKYNMVSHRNTHSGAKRVKCQECDKAFYKSSDLDRHMKTHSGEKQYECVGPLKNGEKWGCRKKFARADKLKQHRQSETGRRCMQPLLDEQAREQEEKEEREREHIRAEEAAKELERVKAEKEAALEQAKKAESEEARELARKYAEVMSREWGRIQAGEEARKKAQKEAEERRRSHTPVHIPAITVEPPPPPEGSTALPPFSSLTRALSDDEPADCTPED